MSAYAVPENTCALHKGKLHPTISDPFSLVCFCCREQLNAADELAKAAKAGLDWMRPVMDGFSVSEDAKARTKVLDPLTQSLAAYKKVRGGIK